MFNPPLAANETCAFTVIVAISISANKDTVNFFIVLIFFNDFVLIINMNKRFFLSELGYNSADHIFCNRLNFLKFNG
jgi:hypothetical protein